MISIDRKLGGLVPYKAVFFPTDALLAELTERSKPTQMAKVFWTPNELRSEKCVVRHYRSATVCIDLNGSLDTISKGVAKNTRYEIRQAEKLGDRVGIGRNGNERVEEFLALYNDFARSKPELSAINHGAFSRYAGHAETFIAYLDERPVCGHVLLRDAGIGRARLLYSASRRFDDREAARLCGTLNRFLHWHELCAYQEERFSTYDLGGIQEDKTNGITQFKMSFGGQIVKEHTYLCAGIPWVGRAAQALFENLSKRGRRWRPLVASASQALERGEPQTSQSPLT
ncbi:MAG TPA: GNAT family N-acetyltransferase [Candidatus Binataceae bacterium]|nr:GNAT family N-acetyltransferase [Candidatus Binataceae bacterium]